MDKLRENPLGYALESVRWAKDDVIEEFMRSMANPMMCRESEIISMTIAMRKRK